MNWQDGANVMQPGIHMDSKSSMNVRRITIQESEAGSK